jgi:dipeptide/tripeptide permease
VRCPFRHPCNAIAFGASAAVMFLLPKVAWAAATLLLAAVVVHTIGELWHSAAGFEVSFALAPQHATGQYLGVFGLGAGLAEAVGPALLISLCITILRELPLRRIHDHAAP